MIFNSKNMLVISCKSCFATLSIYSLSIGGFLLYSIHENNNFPNGNLSVCNLYKDEKQKIWRSFSQFSICERIVLVKYILKLLKYMYF